MSKLETIENETGPAPTASVIVLHGLGADGGDFVPIARELSVGRRVPMRFVFPSAPTMPVTINNGYVMRAWYDILGVDLARREDRAGLLRSVDAVEALIAAEKERGVPAHRIVIAGFSQGCAMALLVGTRHRERLGGLIGLSGYLPLAAELASARSEAGVLTPIFLAHGTQDPVVQIARGRESREALKSAGYTVAWHEYPMPHSVSPAEIADLDRWLAGVLES